jgi:diguanylate cyclase (GGDEF)-like protein
MTSMNNRNSDYIPPSLDPGEQILAEEGSRIDEQDSWVRKYSIFVSLLLTSAIIALAFLALRQGTETSFKIRLTEAIFGLIALIILFNVYTVRQEILIKRLRTQLAEKHSQFYTLRNLSMIDPLTGLYNRRFAEQRLAAEVARSERNGQPLGVLLLDVSNFTQINETYTRAAGDQVLQDFASRLSRVIRASDLAVRLDADEFLIVLPDCTGDQLKRVLGRLSPSEVDWRGQKIPVTFTAAWKQYELGERPEDLLSRADLALSAAKRNNKTTHVETLAL